MGEILNRAVNPTQYDHPEVIWRETGSSPGRKYFWHYLEPFAANWANKDLLEIGSGTGWLLKKACGLGVNSALGLEPSKRNIGQANNSHPELTLMRATLEDFETDSTYDVEVAVAVLGHIKNLDVAFNKLARLQREGGEVLVTIPDFEYFRDVGRSPLVQIEDITEDEFAVLTVGRNGFIADLVRKDTTYVKCAEKAGLVLTDSVPMPPTEELMEDIRFYRARELPIWHLLQFKAA